MASDPKRLVSVCYADGVVECRPCCHQGSGAEHALLMKLLDSAIGARGEAEIIRVDDEAGRHEGMRKQWVELVGSEGLEPPTSCL